MSDTVQQIKDKLNIIDVVSPYVELHKAGKNFKGKSPFAAEKTPSFYVSPDRGMYYCFSTSQGGDIFNFVEAMEGVDFKGALKILADKAGVELVPEDPKKKSERDRWYAALQSATDFYVEKLASEKEAKEYLEDRGVKAETISNWKIGYAPGPPHHSWRETKESLESQGYTKDEILKVGLIKTTDSGKDPFDVFRDRIVFPMAEPSGRVVAFSGRILHPDDKAPKYVNSPDTELYKKSDLLYGYDKAKTGIRNLDFSLIVEGQFDVVMCHQAGYSNTVAVSGTALTLNHVQLLERMSDKVVLALDADRAGINAMKKGAELMLQRGLDVKVAELPLGKDPADLIKENPDDFKKVIGQSVHVIEFLLHVLRREIKDDRSFKLKARDEIYPFILLLPSRVDQDHFEKLVSEVTNVSKDAVHFELERLREEAKLKPQREITKPDSGKSTSVSSSVSNSNDVVYKSYLFLLAAGEVVDGAMDKKIKSEIKEIAKISEPKTPSDSELAGIIFTLEQQFNQLPELAVKEEILAKLNQFKTNSIRQKISQSRQLLSEGENQEDDKKVSDALNEIKEYEVKLREPAYEVVDFFAE